MLRNLKKYIHKVSAPLFLPSVNKKNWEQRVLLIKVDAIGDFFLFTGLLKNYLRYYRDKEVYLAVDKCCMSVAKLYLPEERLICVDRNRYYSDPAHRLQVLSRIREIGFSTVINSIVRLSIHDDLTMYSAGEKRYGFDVGRRKKQLYITHNQIILPGEPLKHVLQWELDFYNGITEDNLALEDVLPYIPLESSQFSIGHPYFVLLPEAGHVQRMYPWDKYIELVKVVNKNYGLKCVVLGGGQSSVVAFTNNPNIINMIGQTDLLGTLKIIKNASFVLGNETGVTHAAWIMQKPTIMIYGGGHYTRCGGFLPLNQCCQTINKEMECYGCGWNCKFSNERFKCIQDITLEEILDEIDILIANIANISSKQEVEGE